MIDIIIPVYNANKTLYKTLASIKLQTIVDKVKVYIIDDFSTCNYDEVRDFYKNDLNITFLKNSKNIGPGLSRQYGIENSNSEYIVFMDSDDQFYDCYSLEKLYKEINDNSCDYVFAKEYDEKQNKVIDSGSLHGKIYRRSLIEKNNIKFNNTKYSEDNSFNSICFLLSINNCKELKDIVYIYVDNKESITNKQTEEEKLILLTYNEIWKVLNLKKRNVNNELIANDIFCTYIYLFNNVIKNKYDFDNLYKKCFRFEQMYLEYEKYISKICYFSIIKDAIEYDYNRYDTFISEFNSFRNRFRRDDIC